ncbi:hypothetical protein ACLOJK_032508 [Asimina triloba]
MIVRFGLPNPISISAQVAPCPAICFSNSIYSFLYVNLWWSKIARHLPGRTDNEIKNFWRTRIQKQMKQTGPFTNQTHDLADSASSSHTSSRKGADTYLPAYPTIDQEQFATPPPTESTDYFWNMDDLWSAQLFNGD